MNWNLLHADFKDCLYIVYSEIKHLLTINPSWILWQIQMKLTATNFNFIILF